MCANKDGDKKIRKVSSRRQGNETQRTKKFDDGFKQDLTKMERWSEQQYSIRLSWSFSTHTPGNKEISFGNILQRKYTCRENPGKSFFFRNIWVERRSQYFLDSTKQLSLSIICRAHIFIWSKRQWKLLLNYLWESLKKNNFPSSFSSVCEVSCVSPNPRSKVTLVGSLGPSPLNRPTS